jgi:hypothetical protein
MNHPDDEQLRARFSALRDYDRESEPELRGMLDRARSRARSGTRAAARTLQWVAAAACLVLGAALLVGKTRHDVAAPGPVSNLPVESDWQSPTAPLLETRVRALMAPPPLLSSVFDGVVPPTLQMTID